MTVEELPVSLEEDEVLTNLVTEVEWLERHRRYIANVQARNLTKAIGQRFDLSDDAREDVLALANVLMLD